MAFTPYAGAYGDFKAILVAPDFTVPFPTITGTPAAISGITKWSYDPKVEQPEPLWHFQSTVTTQGLLTCRRLTGGTIAHEFALEGWFDGAATATMILFENGAWVKVDLLLNKTSANGFHGVGGKIDQMKVLGPEAKGSTIVKFTAQLLVDGDIPDLSTT